MRGPPRRAGPVAAPGPLVLTCQVVMLLALVVRQRHELPEQQRVLEHPLNGLDEVGLQRGGVLLRGVPGVQKSLEGFVSFRCRQMDERASEEHSRGSSILLHLVFNGVRDRPLL